MKRFYPKKNVVDGYRWFLMPVNIKRLHWYLVAVDLENEVIYVLDSLMEDRDKPTEVNLMPSTILFACMPFASDDSLMITCMR